MIRIHLCVTRHDHVDIGAELYGGLMAGDYRATNALVCLVTDQLEARVTSGPRSGTCLVWAAIVDNNDVVHVLGHRLYNARDVELFPVRRNNCGYAGSLVHRIGFPSIGLSLEGLSLNRLELT